MARWPDGPDALLFPRNVRLARADRHHDAQADRDHQADADPRWRHAVENPRAPQRQNRADHEHDVPNQVHVYVAHTNSRAGKVQPAYHARAGRRSGRKSRFQTRAQGKTFRSAGLRRAGKFTFQVNRRPRPWQRPCWKWGVTRRVHAVLLVVAAAVGFGRDAQAYSVLTHQAIVDTVWAQSLAPLLRARYRGVPPDALEKARAYAYGGCIIQDMGYCPFSSKTFSDLTHYVRSADFIKALIDEAESVDEYAFALGALAHYAADTHGHGGAVNQAVPMIYPKVRAEPGPNVPYEKNPTAHIRTEFAFDVVQLARGSYLPNSYHRAIGFEVAKPVLERAFLRTYGLELGDVFGNLDLAIGTYRRT